jgi:lipopolysaccharide export LptBFGC system permease protein LptF
MFTAILLLLLCVFVGGGCYSMRYAYRLFRNPEELPPNQYKSVPAERRIALAKQWAYFFFLLGIVLVSLPFIVYFSRVGAGAWPLLIMGFGGFFFLAAIVINRLNGRK